MLHGLYWLLNNLTSESPVALSVDDLHWADAESLRFLAYLAHRLEGLPVLVVGALRTGEEHVDSLVLDELSHSELTVPVQVIWGTEDRILPVSHAKRLPASLPVTVLDGAGHMVHMEKAAEVNQKLLAFIG